MEIPKYNDIVLPVGHLPLSIFGYLVLFFRVLAVQLCGFLLKRMRASHICTKSVNAVAVTSVTL